MQKEIKFWWLLAKHFLFIGAVNFFKHIFLKLEINQKKKKDFSFLAYVFI